MNSKSDTQQKWRGSTAKRKVEAYLEPEVITRLDTIVKEGGFKGRGEAMTRLILDGLHVDSKAEDLHVDSKAEDLHVDSKAEDIPVDEPEIPAFKDTVRAKPKTRKPVDQAEKAAKALKAAEIAKDLWNSLEPSDYLFYGAFKLAGVQLDRELREARFIKQSALMTYVVVEVKTDTGLVYVKKQFPNEFVITESWNLNWSPWDPKKVLLFSSTPAYERYRTFINTHNWHPVKGWVTDHSDLKTLGLKAGSFFNPVSDKEIRAAYKKLASKYHPDRKGGSVEKMAELNAARDRLLKA